MTENMQVDDVQNRQVCFVRCCLSQIFSYKQKERTIIGSFFVFILKL